MFDVSTLKAIYANIGTLLPIGKEKAPIGKDWQNAKEFHAGMFTTGRYGLRPNEGLIIVDIDVKANINGFETIENLGLDLPATLTQTTPSGGQHRWYRVKQGASLPNAVNVFAGIDLRAPHKGQCLVYPTQGYEWLDLAIDEGETPTLDLIAELPIGFIDQITAQNPFKNHARFNAPLSELDGVATGSRNDYLASIAGTMRKKGQTGESINEGLQAVNIAMCKPPLSAEEVATIAKSIARYESGGTLADISAFMANISSDQALLQQQGTNKARFHLTHCRDLLAEPKPVKWLIKGVLMAETIALLYGDPASGKSLVAIDWTANIVNGGAWLGNHSEIGAAVILAGEGHHGLSRRLKAWELANNQQIEGNLFVSSTGTNLDNYQGLTDVVTAIDSMQDTPAIIVVDTLHRNFSGDENSAKDIGALISNLDTLRHRYACTVLIVHHSGNGEKGRARGSSSLKAAVDTSYRLDNNGARSLVCDKAKDFRPTETINFDLTEVRLGWFDDDGIEETSVVLTPTDTKPTPRHARLSGANLLAFETFFDAGNGEPVQVDEWRECFYQKHTGDNVRTKKQAFSRARKDLTESGVFSANNDIYSVNPIGSVYGDLTGHIGGHLIKKQMNALSGVQGYKGIHSGDIVADKMSD
jgi:hypothetical protein